MVDGKVLVERRHQKDADGGKICFPAGHIEKNETPEQALIREMDEELGIDVADFDFLCREMDRNGDNIYELNYFLCKKWNGRMQPNIDVMWLERNELPLLNFDKDRLIAEKVMEDGY